MHKQGGLEKYLDRLARYFMQQGASVSVLTSSRNGDFSRLPYRIRCISSPCCLSWFHLLLFDHKVKQVLSQNKTQGDILFGFDRHFVALTHYRAGNGCHRAYLEKRRISCGWLKRMLLWLNPLHWVVLLSEKKTVECHKTITICNSHMVKKEFLRWYPKADPSHIKVIHNGVEWAEYEASFQQREHERVLFCRDNGIDPSLPHILFVGNEWERKGVRLLLHALSAVKTPFRCTIVGKEKRWQQFHELAHQLKIEKNVFFYPTHEKVLPWYQRADIFVLPTLYDPFANVTVEALAMGLWVITSSSNGGGEVIREGLTGSVITSFDKQPWTRALEAALLRVQKESNLKDRIREEARQFDFTHTLQAYGDLIMRRI